MTPFSQKQSPSSNEERKHVDNFDPERQAISAKSWLERLESFACESHLSDDQTYAFARGKLRGTAKDWLATSTASGWHEFRGAFLEAFPTEPPQSRLVHSTKHRALDRRHKHPQEDVHEYIEEMVRIGKRVQVTEQVIVRYILAGLKDPVLSRAIPFGTGLRQLRKAIEWQQEVGTLMRQYDDSEVSVDDFERIADNLERIVLGFDGNVCGVLMGESTVLEVIGDELSALLQRHRLALSCGLSNLGTSKTHQLVVRLNPEKATPAAPNSNAAATLVLDADTKCEWQSSLISLLTCDVIQKASSTTGLVLPARLIGSEILPDFTHLNGICCREEPNFLLPIPLLTALSGFQYFTVLDFNAGHLQIPVEDTTRTHLTFSTPYGPFEFRCAPKHFANTTIVFNKILIELARKLPTGDVVVLQDVLVLPARDTPEGLQKLSRVLVAIEAFGLTLDLRRSRFFESSLKLFGWIVEQGRVSVSSMPIERPASPNHRLVLLVNAHAKTYQSRLERHSKANGRHQTVSCFVGKDQSHDGDARMELAEHLVASIEHFRQFLLFVPFEVVLSSDFSALTVTRQMLLQVQQYDFDLRTEEEPQNLK